MSRHLSGCIVLLALVPTLACTTRIGDLTVASPKNIPTHFEVVQQQLTGEDCVQLILGFIPIGTLNPTLDGAIDDALAKTAGRADALADLSIFQDFLYLLLYAEGCMRVEGTAVRTR